MYYSKDYFKRKAQPTYIFGTNGDSIMPYITENIGSGNFIEESTGGKGLKSWVPTTPIGSLG